MIADCLSLKRKQYFPKKEVAFVNSVNSCLSSEQRDELPDPTYLPFLFKGFVSLQAGRRTRLKFRCYVIQELHSLSYVLMSCRFQINLQLVPVG